VWTVRKGFEGKGGVMEFIGGDNLSTGESEYLEEFFT
jgi:hypothetical protein